MGEYVRFFFCSSALGTYIYYLDILQPESTVAHNWVLTIYIQNCKLICPGSGWPALAMPVLKGIKLLKLDRVANHCPKRYYCRFTLNWLKYPVAGHGEFTKHIQHILENFVWPTVRGSKKDLCKHYSCGVLLRYYFPSWLTVTNNKKKNIPRKPKPWTSRKLFHLNWKDCFRALVNIWSLVHTGVAYANSLRVTAGCQQSYSWKRNVSKDGSNIRLCQVKNYVVL